MGLSVWHVVVVLVVVLILFGAGKLPQVMGDVAKGIKNFKAGVSDDDDKPRDAAPEGGVAEAPVGIARQSTTTAPEAANSAGTRADGATASGVKS